MRISSRQTDTTRTAQSAAGAPKATRAKTPNQVDGFELPRQQTASSSTPQQASLLGRIGQLVTGPAAATAALIGAAAAAPLALMISGDAMARAHVNPRALHDDTLVSVVRPAETDATPSAIDKVVFDKLDRNKDGRIKRDEVVDYMKSIGVDRGLFGLIHSQGSKAIMKELDGNKDGSVKRGEMTAALAKIKDPDGLMKPENVGNTFRGFDRNNDGKLTSSEIQRVVSDKLPPDTPYASLVSKNVTRFLTDIMDTNRDKKVSSTEFSNATASLNALRTQNAER